MFNVIKLKWIILVIEGLFSLIVIVGFNSLFVDELLLSFINILVIGFNGSNVEDCVIFVINKLTFLKVYWLVPLLN